MNRRVRTAEAVHPGPPFDFQGGPPKTTSRPAVFCEVVRRSTPILYCCDSRQKREKENNVFNKKRMRNQGGPPDHPRCETGAVRRFAVVHPESRRMDRVDHPSAEVTL